MRLHPLAPVSRRRRNAHGGIVRLARRALVTVAALALALASATTARAATFTRLQVLLPGETAAPGTPSGKTGTPRAQTAGVPFSITLRGTDGAWNTVAAATDIVQPLASDASAPL